MRENGFDFVEDFVSKKWVIIAPKRAKRPGIDKGVKKNFCPFCPGSEIEEEEVFRINKPGKKDWQVRVIKNKFPFAPIHEIVVHSPHHHKNFAELEYTEVEKIFFAYQLRFQEHTKKGQVLIFNNRGRVAGESIGHPHTQIAVVPFKVSIQTLPKASVSGIIKETKFFKVYKPEASEWPWEVWVAPKRSSKTFASSHASEVADLARIAKDLTSILSKKLGKDFPFNFYIYPGKDWYFRFIPRSKSIGGFELSTGIFVNSLEPKEAVGYLRKNLR